MTSPFQDGAKRTTGAGTPSQGDRLLRETGAERSRLGRARLTAYQREDGAVYRVVLEENDAGDFKEIERRAVERPAVQV